MTIEHTCSDSISTKFRLGALSSRLFVTKCYKPRHMQQHQQRQAVPSDIRHIVRPV